MLSGPARLSLGTELVQLMVRVSVVDSGGMPSSVTETWAEQFSTAVQVQEISPVSASTKTSKEQSVPSTLQGPSAKGPGSEGWVEPGAAEEQAKAPQEGNAAETIPGEQEILPPGAEPTGDQSLQEAEPQDRMAIRS